MTTVACLMVRAAVGVSNAALFKVAADLAARLKANTVIGIGACQPTQLWIGTGAHQPTQISIGIGAHLPTRCYSPEAYVPADFMNWECDQIDKDLKAAETEFRTALGGKAAMVEWRSSVITEGTIAGYVAAQMRAADLLVTALGEGASFLDSSRHADVADIVLRAGKPVLVVGPTVDQLDLRNVVVAWKETREARRAVQDALPLLVLADHVTVVEVAASGDLPDAGSRTRDVAGWLEEHGVNAAARAVAASDEAAEQLRDIVEELGAGLVVGGAYGHMRLREWALGGVTRDLLLRPARCSLVSH